MLCMRSREARLAGGDGSISREVWEARRPIHTKKASTWFKERQLVKSTPDKDWQVLLTCFRN